LSEFGLRAGSGDKFRLEYPWSPPFTQPDVRIESPSGRVFIEIKVDEKIKLKQVQRYLLLHALMDILYSAKRPYLFFLGKKEFKKCWRPSNDASDYGDVQSFLQRQTAGQVPEALARRLPKEKAKAAREQHQIVKREVVYGTATWNAVGDCLAKLRPGEQCRAWARR
jgi:hypothetical protein